VLAAQSADFERDLRQDLTSTRTEQAAAAQTARTELGATLAQHAQTMQQQLTGMAVTQSEQMKHFTDRLAELTRTNEQRLEAVRATVEQKLEALRADNTQKLDQMRATVDEKLQATLDQRLGASFKQVSDRLEQVHKGLGEMQTLAAGVGDLKRVLTNVKSRGTWGSPARMLLSEVLTPQQYESNVETVPGSKKRVEFAIRFPGRGNDGLPCWLPVDAKFPLDDWQRLQDALSALTCPPPTPRARRSPNLCGCRRRRSASRTSRRHTRPTSRSCSCRPKGLYAEMMARPGFGEQLQRDYRVTLTGPTNFLALLEQPADGLPHAGDRAAVE
jgi:DNA recombination protein RmuC